ncbi:ribosome maturation factor RimP [candidate division KSB1 bacterium]
MSESVLSSKIAEIVDSRGFDLIEIKVEKRGKIDIVKVYLDKDKGISIQDCSSVSREINDAIFKYDLIVKEYRLEVSSPGIDRPLISMKDFQRNISRKVEVKLKTENGSETISGEIISADEDIIILKQKKTDKEIPFSEIIEGKIILPW